MTPRRRVLISAIDGLMAVVGVGRVLRAVVRITLRGTSEDGLVSILAKVIPAAERQIANARTAVHLARETLRAFTTEQDPTT